MTTTEIVLPIIHLNGTSKEALQTDILTALDKLSEAQAALSAMAPNQRDYYPAPDRDRWQRALLQHQRRMRVLAELRAELVAQWEGIEALG